MLFDVGHFLWPGLLILAREKALVFLQAAPLIGIYGDPCVWNRAHPMYMCVQPVKGAVGNVIN